MSHHLITLLATASNKAWQQGRASLLTVDGQQTADDRRPHFSIDWLTGTICRLTCLHCKPQRQQPSCIMHSSSIPTATKMAARHFKASWMGTAFAIHHGSHAFAPSPATELIVPSSFRRNSNFPSSSSISPSPSLSASSVTDDRHGASKDAMISLVPRVTLEEFLANPVYDRPTLVRDIITPDQVESIAEELVSRMGDAQVQLQRTIRDDIDEDNDGGTEIYDVTLQEAAEYMMDSSYDDSLFAFCEGLLDDKSDDDDCAALSSRLSEIREAPFRGENWFDYFPPSIRPTDAVILAGEGSCSTLHRDPFEWTGTSICLEGTKIWRFILPNEEDGEGGVRTVDDALESYRLDSIAWTMEDEKKDPLVLSRGWQSDLFFYARRAEDIPSAMELSELEDNNMDSYVAEIEAMATDFSLLSPDEQISDLVHSKQFDFATAIQQAGDLLIIPAHCWHQTYAPVPSIAVASQRCGAAVDGASVVQHVLESLSNTRTETVRPPDILMMTRQSDYRYQEGDGKKVVDALVEHLSSMG